MGYPSLRACVDDLERSGQLVRIQSEIDPYLEAAEIQRRLYRQQGPALLFERLKGCRFPAVCNLFGSLERTRFLFRDTLEAVRHLVELKTDPDRALRQPWRYRDVFRGAWNMRVKTVSSGPVLAQRGRIQDLPQLHFWPDDGGAFITLPQVYSEDVERPGWAHSNLGMYRVQLSGGNYHPNAEIGLHYQIHRGIGVHHAAALRQKKPFRVNIFVGGPPAMTLAAVMPLPEGMTELGFAGALGGRRVRMTRGVPGDTGRLPIAVDADFCIVGTVDPSRLLPEGPFGDHLGYYSLTHDFPVLKVEQVYHRADAIWPFTAVGRPPQEDTSFGQFIHELTGPIIPTVIPGVKGVHAVDAAGVHPLLLAIGSERYTPYQERRVPQELLTTGHAILGQGQLSLAKFLLLLAQEDIPRLDVHDIAEFFQEWLKRVNWERDLHFQTCTTIDTLDYSGDGLNSGSKVMIPAVGPPCRSLPTSVPADISLPTTFQNPRIPLPGILVLKGPVYQSNPSTESAIRAEPGIMQLLDYVGMDHPLNQFPLVVVVDDSEMAGSSLQNFLWVTFTRTNPATDLHGVGEFQRNKHWGCRGSLILDARIKPHHAPPLIEDPGVTRRVDALAARGGPLHGIL